jgi:hypothetical protein
LKRGRQNRKRVRQNRKRGRQNRKRGGQNRNRGRQNREMEGRRQVLHIVKKGTKDRHMRRRKLLYIKMNESTKSTESPPQS